jgi:hypothetical protein
MIYRTIAHLSLLSKPTFNVLNQNYNPILHVIFIFLKANISEADNVLLVLLFCWILKLFLWNYYENYVCDFSMKNAMHRGYLLCLK